MSSGGYSASTIASWFVAWANEVNDDHMTHLKLQKVLYYAQGHYLSHAGAPLFSNALQAWRKGPVVPEVYAEYSSFKSDELELGDDNDFVWSDVDETTTQFLIKVWNTYGKFSAEDLVDMSHDESPWRNHYEPDVMGIEIPLIDIKGYFDTTTRVS